MKGTLLFLGALVYCLLCNTNTVQGQQVDIQETEAINVQDEEIRYSKLSEINPVGEYYGVILEDFSSEEVTMNPSARLAIINQGGEIVEEPGGTGKGPFESEAPEGIQQEDGFFIFWDSQNRKFLSFTEDFREDEEITGIQHNLKDFAFKGKEKVGLVHQVPNQPEFIKIYHRKENGELSLETSLGNLTDEGLMLFFIDKAGGVLWNGDDLVYSDPAVPELKIYNTETGEEQSVSIDDPQFEVEEWEGEATMNTQKDFEQMEAYIFDNSRIVSLHRLEEYILAEVEHYSDNESQLTYHLFDLQYNAVGTVSAGEGGWEHYIYGTGENTLFYWPDDLNESGELDRIIVKELQVQ